MASTNSRGHGGCAPPRADPPPAVTSNDNADAPPAPPRLPPLCLRCAKQVANRPDIVCTRAHRHVKCDRCRRNSSKCVAVPRRFAGSLARLQDAARAQLAAVAAAKRPGLTARARARDLQAATDALARLQLNFTYRVEAWLRRTAKVTVEERRLQQETRIADCLEHIMIAVHSRWGFAIPQLEEEEGEEGEEESDDDVQPVGPLW